MCIISSLCQSLLDSMRVTHVKVNIVEITAIILNVWIQANAILDKINYYSFLATSYTYVFYCGLHDNNSRYFCLHFSYYFRDFCFYLSRKNRQCRLQHIITCVMITRVFGANKYFVICNFINGEREKSANTSNR